ncbi:MAG: hypothetical protein R3360_07970, partial [Alphaproteobacteria bacterium]|nr:hypothetical protein [Alphaproteobacteria bacterium]
MTSRVLLKAFLAAAFVLLAAGGARAVNPEAVLAETPPRLLSAYGLFEDARSQKPAPGVVLYRLNTPLFTDYAAKLRFVYMPEGSAAAYHEEEAFAFPVGTVLVKTFAYPADFREPEANIRLIETRLMIRKPGGWVALPYVWNEDMTEAVLKKAGARVNVETIHTSGRALSIDYRVPNVNQCKG